MNILFACGQALPPQFLCGSNWSVVSIARLLARQGHAVTLLCGLWGSGYFAWRNKLMMRFVRDRLVADDLLGVPTFRTWLPWDNVGAAIARTGPDVVVIPAHRPVRMALAARKAGGNIVMMLQDVLMDAHEGDFAELGNVPCIANSTFTAQTHRRVFGVQPAIVHPVVDRTHYETPTARENVTFINPDPKKGADIAIRVARACPDIPFAFYQSWPLKRDVLEQLVAEINPLPNVTLHPATRDMRKVYAKARILLVPTRVEEAFGRVVVEAQYSGIPAVASNIGGLPEALGPGGLLVDRDAPIEAWVHAVRSLWDDAAHYEAVSRAARSYSQRVEMDPTWQVKAWEEHLRRVAENPDGTA